MEESYYMTGLRPWGIENFLNALDERCRAEGFRQKGSAAPQILAAQRVACIA